MRIALAAPWSRGIMLVSPSTDSPVTVTPITEEVMIPEQFFTPADRSQIAWTPERRLLLAVLEDAVVMCLRYRHDCTTRGKRLFRETLAWFVSTDRTSLCAFETICDYLNLDADYLRQGLRRLIEPAAAMPISSKNLFRQLRHTNWRVPVIPEPECS